MLLTPKDVKKAYNLTDYRLEIWEKNGVVSVQRSEGGHRRYLKEEIERALGVESGLLTPTELVKVESKDITVLYPQVEGDISMKVDFQRIMPRGRYSGQLTYLEKYASHSPAKALANILLEKDEIRPAELAAMFAGKDKDWRMFLDRLCTLGYMKYVGGTYRKVVFDLRQHEIYETWLEEYLVKIGMIGEPKEELENMKTQIEADQLADENKRMSAGETLSKILGDWFGYKMLDQEFCRLPLKESMKFMAEHKLQMIERAENLGIALKKVGDTYV